MTSGLLKCKQHPGCVLDNFCVPCEVPLCRECSSSAEHRGHDCKDVRRRLEKIHKTKDGDTVLMCLLLSPLYTINVEEKHWIEKYNAVAGIFKSRMLKKISQLGNLRKCRPILKYRGPLVTFSHEFTRHASFLKYADDPRFVDIFLTWAEKENIAEYCRTWNYPPNNDEIFCRLVPQQTEQLIERLGQDIFSHPTWRDTSIHDLVFSKVGMPMQIILKGDKSVTNFIENLKKGKTTIYHASGMIIGCAGSGKTTLLERLKGIDLKEILGYTRSTRGVDIHTVFDVTDSIEVNPSSQKQHFKVMFDEASLHEHAVVVTNDKEKRITMTDFAGQCSYYDSHQIFLSPRAFFILVLNMEKKFDDKVGEEMCCQEGSVYEGWTHRDFLTFWIKSIHQYNSEKAPVLVVGTHAEQLTSEEKEKFFREIWRSLETNDASLQRHIDRKRMFAVGFHENECIEKIKLSVVDVVKNLDHWGEKLPYSWAVFENFFQEKKNLKIINKETLLSFNEALQQGLKLETVEDINTMLQFFVEIRKILHFDQDSLRGIIILDVQWFADAFKNVITDKNHAAEDLFELASQWDKFNETGVLSDILLSAIWEMNNNGYLEHKDEIMLYMEKLGLVSKMDNTKWFVPCMNKRQFNIHRFSSYPASSILCYMFDVLPVGIFHRLVAICVQFPWKILNENNDQPCIYQTAAVFLFEEHNVLLGMTQSEIQLQVSVIEGEVDDSICHQIREKIERILHDLSNTFNKNCKFQVGFKCKPIGFCDGKKSSVIAESKFTSGYFLCPSCPVDNKHLIYTEDITKYWKSDPEEAFNKELQQGSCKIRQIRIMVVGHYGVGKTTLTYGLIGQDKKGIESTDGIDLFRARCRIDNSNDDSQKWCLVKENISPAELAAAPSALPSVRIEQGRKLETSDETYMLRNRKNLVTERQKQLLNSRSLDPGVKTDETDAPLSKTAKDSHETSPLYDTLNADDGQCANPGPSSMKVEEKKQLRSKFYTKTKEAWKADLENRMKDIFIDMWDFGGQNVFYTTHQSFLTSRCIYLLVINCAKDSKATIGDRALYPTQQSESKVEDFMDFWISTITNYAKSEAPAFPRIILIGTHVDEVGENASKRVEKVCTQIKERYQDLVSKGQLVINKNLFINAKDTDEEKHAFIREFIIQEAKLQPY